jgi:uncharacterized sporulation protein YeaH/YhbH (DUF444 family)
VDVRYVIHDAAAREVDQQAFYHTRESGGTAISSAYRLCNSIIREDYDPAEWNIYPFHFTDGDNWEDDNAQCAQLLATDILPYINLFCYGEVRGPRDCSRFMKELDKLALDDGDRLVTTTIKDKNGIYDAISAFLGKGR